MDPKFEKTLATEKENIKTDRRAKLLTSRLNAYFNQIFATFQTKGMHPDEFSKFLQDTMTVKDFTAGITRYKGNKKLVACLHAAYNVARIEMEVDEQLTREFGS